MHTKVLKVTGMSCGGCTSNVTRSLKAVEGVADAKVSLATGEAIVQYDEQTASPGQLKSAVEDAGYGVRMADTASIPKSKGCCCGSKNASTPA